MELSDNLFTGFNKQYNTEVGNFGMYQNLANIAENLKWDGFSKFLREYALEEITHAQKIADYTISRGKTPFVDTIPNPEVGNSPSPLIWMQTALGKAKNYTALIQDLYKQCEIERDNGAQIFLMWYVSEQERVENVLWDLVQQCLRADSNATLLLIDQSLLGDK